MATKYSVKNEEYINIEADLAVILVDEEAASKAQLRKHGSYADAVRLSWLEQMLDNKLLRSEFQGKAGQVKTLYCPAEAKFSRVVFVGTGPAALNLENIYTAVAKGIIAADKHNPSKVVVGLRPLDTGTHNAVVSAGAAMKAAIIAHYAFETYKSKKTYSPYSELIINMPDEKDLGDIYNEVTAMYTMATAANYTRDLVNLRSEEGTPAYYANQAVELGKLYPKLVVSVLDEAKLQEMGMGLILGVGKGSKNRPNVVVFDYKGGESDQYDVALIGKGITYDSGGMNLKSSAHDMYDDMGGAAAVFGAMRSIAALKIKKNIIGACAFAENMLSRDCVRAGDVLKAYNGTTVEIKNTDAEGRLVLADTISYVCSKYKPGTVVDICTLTGAIVSFLGENIAGVWTKPQHLGFDLVQPANNIMEPVWPCPFRDEYESSLKSDVADMSNSTARGGNPAKGGANVAALFLNKFVQAPRHVHLDIAGTVQGMSWIGGQGASGYGVNLLVHIAKTY